MMLTISPVTIISHPIPYPNPKNPNKQPMATGKKKETNSMTACKPLLSHLLAINPRIRLSCPTTSTRDKNTTTRRSLLLLSTILISPISLAAAEDSVFDPVTVPEKNASTELSRRVSEALQLLDVARDFQAKGEFSQALDYFTQVIKDYKDFAFTDYARVGRALVLYEIGDREESIAEMEDVSISLKGYPEIHAALAAALYADKNAPLLAENQFTIATLLDPHYTDLSYVKDTKHWPPSLVSSLQHFITLS